MLCFVSTGLVSADMAAAAVISDQVSLTDFSWFCSYLLRKKKSFFDLLKAKKRHEEVILRFQK